jgi:uncharacterized phage protein gp47/JayE
MADFNYIVSTGVIVPDTSETRSGVEAEWRAALGQDLPVTSETPQGAMITMEVESRDAVARNNAELANQINPAIAGGIFLDAIWALMGGGRRGATRSIIPNVQLNGAANTPIPAGSLATVEITGEQFRLVSTVVLDSTGSALGQFEAVELGPITVLPGRLVEIASSVLGWEQVFNANAAIPGQLAESDIASRRRRIETLGLQGSGNPEAITSRLHDLDGVRSLSFWENYTKVDMVEEGVTIIANSIYVCVDGGADLDIATALLASKSGGCNWNGEHLIEIIEPSSGQPYAVRFDRPEELIFFARFTIRSTTLDASTIIPQAITAYSAGELEVGIGLGVGDDLAPFELGAAVNEVEPQLFVKKVETSLDGATWTSDVTPILLNQVARLPASAVQVIIG